MSTERSKDFPFCPITHNPPLHIFFKGGQQINSAENEGQKRCKYLARLSNPWRQKRCVEGEMNLATNSMYMPPLSAILNYVC